MIALSGCGGAHSTGAHHGSGRRNGFLVRVDEGLGHGMASRRWVELEEDPMCAVSLEVLADGSRGGCAALNAAVAI